MSWVVVFGALAIVATIWSGWRIGSRRTVIPCPSALSWLVELENPIARATRSEEIIQHLAVRPGERIVDVGCGPGRVTMRLAEAVGAQGLVFAADVQDRMLAAVRANASSRSLQNIQLLRIEATSCRIEVEEADAALMVMMLGEVPDALALLESVYSCLKSSGRLLVAESVFDPHYVRRPQLHGMARRAGFVQVSERGNRFGYSALFGKADNGERSLPFGG